MQQPFDHIHPTVIFDHDPGTLQPRAADPTTLEVLAITFEIQGALAASNNTRHNFKDVMASNFQNISTKPSHLGAPAPIAPQALSPPSKKELTSWWKRFRKAEKTDEKGRYDQYETSAVNDRYVVPEGPGIFGVPLEESIRYAHVAISLTNDEGDSFIYGYVPIVVAKCGVFLKDRGN